MSLFGDRPFFHLALIGLAVASLALAGCGRKGPLDPPPGGSMVSAPASDAPVTADPLVAAPGQTQDGSVSRAVAPAGPNKRIFLDNLLN